MKEEKKFYTDALESLARHKLISFLGLLIVGGLGSGVWELVLYPTMTSFINIVLRLSTLGMESLRDTIYSNGALNSLRLNIDHRSKNGFLNLIYFQAIFIVFAIMAFIEYFDKNLTFRRAVIGYSVLLISLFGMSMAGTIKDRYSIELSLHIDKLETLSDSVVSERIMRKFKAERLQIENREEYLQYEGKLQSLVSGHGFKSVEIDFF